MNPVCARCALRIHRAAKADSVQIARRAFSQTTTRQKGGIPTFLETSSSQLDEKLALLREKHLIPAYLNKHQRRLIFNPKHKQSLEDNPQTATIGTEEIKLQWLDRHSEIPNGKALVKEIIMLNAENDEWTNLPNLLVGLKHSKHTPKSKQMGGIVRQAIQSGRIGIVIQCLQQASRTGMSLKDGDIAQSVVWGLREAARADGWSQENVDKSLRHANQIALLLEAEVHGAMGLSDQSDLRRRPEIMAFFLELEAVKAYKFHGGQDIEGKVKAYSDRLLSCISERPPLFDDFQLRSDITIIRGPQHDMNNGVSIWHGLSVAKKILGPSMPQDVLANKTIVEYEARLSEYAKAIEATNPKEGSYGAASLSAWNDCIRE